MLVASLSSWVVRRKTTFLRIFVVLPRPWRHVTS